MSNVNATFDAPSYIVGAANQIHLAGTNYAATMHDFPSYNTYAVTTLTGGSGYGYWATTDSTTNIGGPWVVNPTPIVWPPTTTVSPNDLMNKLSEQDSEETLEETIRAVQDQALYDVQHGNLTEEQFFEVMKMTFAMLKLIPKKPEEDEDEEEE